MAYLDFTQMYPSITAVLLIGTGLYSVFVERRGYHSQNLVKEARVAKYIGIIWMTAGFSLFICGFVWRNFIW
ncbi:hypothetical protein JZ785_02215 [Alicyclobacillus curvatus]|jgi:hypothetical protein|nr:hypothetical protein JZ785_02215 [Alicyclobacillus curvatus]